MEFKKDLQNATLGFTRNNSELIFATPNHPEVSAVGVIKNPTYLDLFGFEKESDQDAWAKWHYDNLAISPIAAALYLGTLYGLHQWMRSKEPFKLRKALFLWNASLAVFSIAGFARTVPEIINTLQQPNGGHISICKRNQRNAATVFWGLLFGLSKIVELGDTVFIVLRKQRLIFLHYYHHVTVLLYSWLTAHAINSSSTWFGTMNYGIHALMYSYYTLKAVQVKVPKSIAMLITFLQLAQMVAGIGINLYALGMNANGVKCDTQTEHAYYALLMYGSYFFLFAQFFYKAYFPKQSTTKKHN